MNKMDQEATLDFKSLRARFQETQVKTRPPVPDRPRQVAATVIHCEAMHTLIKPATTCSEVQAQAPQKSFHKDAHKQFIQFPVCTLQTTSTQTAGSTPDPCCKTAFKDRHLPLVLPVPFSAEPKRHSLSPPKGVSSPLHGKKITMKPFKSTNVSKVDKGPLENGDTSFSSLEKHTNGFGVSTNGSNPGPVRTSPGEDGTPPPVNSIEGSSTEGSPSPTSHQRVLTTLEKAKRKFSPKQLLEYAKPRSFQSRTSSPSTSPPPPPIDYEGLSSKYDELPDFYQGRDLPPIPPHAPSSSLRRNINFQEYATVARNRSSHNDPSLVAPALNPLPDLLSLGSQPVKPQRPPLVDLTPFISKDASERNGSSPVSVSATLDNEFYLDAPEFPEFDLIDAVILDPNVVEQVPHELPSELPETFENMDLPPPDNPIDLERVIHSDPHSDSEFAGSELPAPPPLPPLANIQSSPIQQTEGAGDGNEAVELSSTQTAESSIIFHRATDQSESQMESFYEHYENIYEDVVPISKSNHFGQNSRKRKGAPKNPYASPPLNELTRKTVNAIAAWSKETGEHMALARKHSLSSRKEHGTPDTNGLKEQRKKERQHLEKEKKEQKERQKKENEMKKKFKVTGVEEPMYYAKVMKDCKVRKHDLPVKSGDTVGIIRTTNCPKGKWLARDANHRYGYVSLKNLELNIEEILELGKRASLAAGISTNEGDTISLGSRSSIPNPVHTSSFTDDSEEWTFDEETMFPSAEMPPCRSMSMPDMYGIGGNVHPVQSNGTVDDLTAQARSDALQKLAIFFQHTDGGFDPTDNGEATPTNEERTGVLEPVQEPSNIEPQQALEEEKQEEEFDFADLELLPPPELYADT